MIFTVRLPSILILIAWSFLQMGCATGPVFKEVESRNPERAVLYIFRPDVMAYYPDIYVSEKKVVALEMSEYTRLELEPGQHLIDVPHHPSRLRCVELWAEKGESYYVISGYLRPKFDLGELFVFAASRGIVGSSQGARPILSQVAPEAAKKWIEKAHFREPEIAYVPISDKGAICSLETIKVAAVVVEAECGSVKEQYELAQAYTYGVGTHPDDIQAYKWLGIARIRLQKEEKALAWLNKWRSTPTNRQKKIHWLGTRLEKLASTMTSGEIAEGGRLAREWKPAKWCED